MSLLARLRSAPSELLGAPRRGRPRTVPVAVLPDAELVHLGGGEMIPCPGVESLPLAPAARRLGLGSPSLALPPAKVHVLRDAVLCPGSRIVREPGGRVVAESLTADMVGRVRIGETEHGEPLAVEGTLALYRSPWRPRYHTLIDHLPRAALLAQPAMQRLGQVTLVHDGPLDPVEQLLLPGLLGPQVELAEVDPRRALRAPRVLLPGYVTRPAAGAIPSWYRRWIDRAVAGLGSPDGLAPLPRRFFVDRVHGPRRVRNREDLEKVLAEHGIQVLDPSTMPVVERLRAFRDAELVVGVTGSGLADVLFSRVARVVELSPGRDLLPHFFYLCASKGLPYEYVPAQPDSLRLDAEQRLRHDVTVDVRALDRLLGRIG